MSIILDIAVLEIWKNKGKNLVRVRYYIADPTTNWTTGYK